MRRYDIDALRVLAFALLIFVHVASYFESGDGGVLKDSVTYDWLNHPQVFFNQWRLSLLFVISGMGTFFNISKRTGWQFAKERVVRLLVPLVFGIIFLVPPMVYFQRVDEGSFVGSYLDFWPAHAFTGIYPTGNFSWHHLWFLPYILFYSLALIPAFTYLRDHPRAWLIRMMKKLTSQRLGLLVLVIPLALMELFLRPYFPKTNAFIGDWYYLIRSGTLFFYGFLLISLKDNYWENIIKNKWLYLTIALCSFALQQCLRYLTGHFPGKWEVADINNVIYEWTMILALLGYAAAYLNKPNKVLSYANEAVYPFYILHFPILITLGYYLKYVDMALLPKFTIMVIGTFGISWLIYEFVVKRWSWVRPLFGMRSKSKCAKQ